MVVPLIEASSTFFPGVLSVDVGRYLLIPSRVHMVKLGGTLYQDWLRHLVQVT